MGRPTTPDFYSYVWSPLTAVSLREGWVTVGWADGTSLACYSLWLAENSVGVGLDPTTREGLLDPGDLPTPEALVAAELGDDGRLRLSWSTGVRSEVHPGWLRHVAEQQHLPRSFVGEQQPWTAADFAEPPSVDGRAVLEDDSVVRRWLVLLARFGLARLTGTPTDPDFLERLADRIGPVRATNFGKMFSVRTVSEPDSLAYTGVGLGQHTDLPTRETPPGFQFLHCIENSVSGGWSRMTDGLSVVAELATAHPEDHEALTSLPWVFSNRSADADHRWIGPIIDHGTDGSPLTIRAFYPVRGFPHMDRRDVPRAYRAMRRFSSVANDPRFQIRSPFRPGDLVGFDNRRVLHGRDPFDSTEGSRVLRGCYLDHDDVYSRLRVLTRQA